MVINLQGFGHFQDDINNQDFALETSNMILLLDGCSGSRYSEAGTRLFSQLFFTLPDAENVEKFEENVKTTFDRLIEQLKVWYPDSYSLESFILENLLFTIIACFNMEDSYIVKIFGDGYIVTQNILDKISYIKFSYGEKPPYFAYKYCLETIEAREFDKYEFQKFIFDKKSFKRVGIATDGIKPIANEYVKGFDELLIKKAFSKSNEMIIRRSRQKFYDDTSFGMFNNEGGISNGNI